jgi:uncharacterized protein YecT (DUF1311 family)
MKRWTMVGAPLLLAAALTLSGALSARAEAADAKDAAIINSCLAELRKTDFGPEKYEAACLLKIADPCMGNDPASVSDGRQIECLDRERLVWDKIVNDSYKSVMNAIEPDQAKKLREVQKAWIHSRDVTCAFFYDYFQGSMAYPMIASCNNRETARRALYLWTFAIDVSERK